MTTNASDRLVKRRTHAIANRPDVIAWIGRLRELIEDQPAEVRCFVNGSSIQVLAKNGTGPGDGFYVTDRDGDEVNDDRSHIDDVSTVRVSWDGGGGT
jgi:hypothetical protein